MKISDLQKQIKINSNNIHAWEGILCLIKTTLNNPERTASQEEFALWRLSKCKKSIKRLAALQKALKKEIAYQIDFERTMRKYDYMVDEREID